MIPDFVCTIEIHSWDELLERYRWHASSAEGVEGKPSRWIFRGQRSAEWTLKTSLERASEEQRGLCTHAHDSAPEESILSTTMIAPKAVDLEGFLLRKFQRECHRFELTSTPADDDFLEWLAWMQHYGAPTRLLDCTYSMFVAVFFAISEATDASNGPTAVWAINDGAMGSGLETFIRDQGGIAAWRQYQRDRDLSEKRTFADLFLANPPLKLAGSVNPFRLNERQVVQQGVFLCPGDVEAPLMENLKVVVDRCSVHCHPIVLRYCFTDDLTVRRDILRHLLRMNISMATLFPGLEGFARSLRQWLAFPDIVGHQRYSGSRNSQNMG